MNSILAPWPWYVVGPLISITMLTLIYFGRSFGISSNLRTLCAMGGAGRFSSFFRFDWKRQIWNLVFVLGIVLGAWLTQTFLSADTSVHIAEATIQELQTLGIGQPGKALSPTEIFSWEGLHSTKGFIMIVIGGVFVGFGTRYAGGCTSGHAISGLSNLQLPSLIAVIGFFAGGLAVTYFVLPWLLQL